MDKDTAEAAEGPAVGQQNISLQYGDLIYLQVEAVEGLLSSSG